MKNIGLLYTMLLLLITTAIDIPAFARNDIPALCYHKVEPVASGRYSVSVDTFKKHMAYLKNNYYKAINSAELLKILETDDATFEKKVFITFDDGFKSVYDYAFPIMQAKGFKGAVFIYPEFIGASAAMTWDQLDELIEAGWTVDSHSMTHGNLAKYIDNPEKEATYLKKEIINSKQIIESRLNNEVIFIAWPYGIYTPQTVALAKKAGYKGAITVDKGSNYQGISKFHIKRQVVYSTDNMNQFLIRLGMRPMTVVDQYPAPGQILQEVTTFSFRLTNVDHYLSGEYMLNVKVTGRQAEFNFDKKTGLITGSINRGFNNGSYYIDFYLRNESTGLTAQNGWLFNIKQ